MSELILEYEHNYDEDYNSTYNSDTLTDFFEQFMNIVKSKSLDDIVWVLPSDRTNELKYMGNLSSGWAWFNRAFGGLPPQYDVKHIEVSHDLENVDGYEWDMEIKIGGRSVPLPDSYDASIVVKRISRVYADTTDFEPYWNCSDCKDTVCDCLNHVEKLK